MLWTYPPVWQTGIIERLEWLTNVIEAEDGSEQRIALRQTPRRIFEFTFLVQERQQAELEAKLWANGAKAWDVPIWTDKAYSTSPLFDGSMVVPVDTAYRDFAVGNKVLLQDKYHQRLATIAAVNASYLTLTAAMPYDMEPETEVTPVRTGYLDQSQQVTRFTGNAIYDVVRFQLDDISSHTAESAAYSYRDYPVYEGAVTGWQNDPVTSYQRKTEIVDFGGGGIYRDDLTGLPKLASSQYWTLTSRQVIADFRAFLYARRGRLNALWLPSFLPDLQLTSTTASAALQLNVLNIGYTDNYSLAKNRRDIRIELQDGTILYRRITACAVIDDQTEQLTINIAPGIDLVPDEIERISFMTFSRLQADAVELAWQWGDLVNVNANWVSTNDDV